MLRSLVAYLLKGKYSGTHHVLHRVVAQLLALFIQTGDSLPINLCQQLLHKNQKSNARRPSLIFGHRSSHTNPRHPPPNFGNTLSLERIPSIFRTEILHPPPLQHPQN